MDIADVNRARARRRSPQAWGRASSYQPTDAIQRAHKPEVRQYQHCREDRIEMT